MVDARAEFSPFRDREVTGKTESEKSRNPVR
jgi:hypothetical protein